MTDEKWNIFMSTGKVEDYFEYKAADREVKEGDINGNDNPQGYSYKGISGR